VIVADGKVLSGRAWNRARRLLHLGARCTTGKEAWRFCLVPAGEPGDETWGGAPPKPPRFTVGVGRRHDLHGG
jgi:hypothetical protein